MSHDDTYIEPSPPQQQPPSEPPDLPPMPPPPGPPERKKPSTALLAVLIGGVVIVLCIIAGFGIWQLYQGGTFSLGDEPTQGADPAALTQTALSEEIPDIEIVTDTPLPAATDTMQPTDPPPPTETSAPTEIPTDTIMPTPDVPIFTASQASFCRLGPSTIYQEARTMEAGESQQILGQSISPVDGISVWWQVEINGARCYVSSGLGTVAGDTSGVPVLEAPATPTPSPTPTPTATPTATPTP